MDNVVQLIAIVFGVLGGSGAFIQWLLYRKQEKRLREADAKNKDAETNSVEIKALRETIKTLQEQINFQAERIDTMQREHIIKDTYNAQLTKENHVLEIKHAKNKSAINKAFECPNREKGTGKSEFCPVLLQRKTNEEEYERSLLAKNKNVDSEHK